MKWEVVIVGSTRLLHPACQCLFLSPPPTAMTQPETQQLSHRMTAFHGGHFSALAHSEGPPQGHLTRLLTPPHQICTADSGDGSVANGDQCHRWVGARPDDFRSNMVALWRSHAPPSSITEMGLHHVISSLLHRAPQGKHSLFSLFIPFQASWRTPCANEIPTLPAKT